MNAPVRRCAIYTRKSSEEGLEQSFNSLHAQREACEAYIKSQAHEGWKLVKTAYDDGGFSGGSMDRPALRQLMADLRQRKVDVVVVYKVDRLTRSLADFAKIVETLDNHKASFVSVTQQFNTTTSMGRLTLNVLLSFAQFEREVTGERIRDKIAASKRKGMWMGGNIPLGYDVRNRQLLVNAAEAETVRYIFRKYAELKTVAALQVDLRQRGIVSKVWKSTSGRERGGQGYSRGALYYLLRNQIYVGRIAHKDQSHQGQHTAIIDQHLWERVQTLLSDKAVGRGQPPAGTNRSPLLSLLHDDRGNLMSPSYTKKRNGHRYRYYVSQALLQNDRARAGTVSRVSADAIEQIVDGEVRRLMLSGEDGVDRDRHNNDRPRQLREIVSRVVLHKDKVEIALAADLTSKEAASGEADEALEGPSRARVLTVPVRLARSGRATNIEAVSQPTIGNRPDAALVKAICRAYEWRGRLERGEADSYRALARLEGLTPAYVRSVLPLAFLSPLLVETFLDGRRRPRSGLMAFLARGLPFCWRRQGEVA